MDTLGAAPPGRRQAAPHPGPMIASELLAPLHLDATALAERIGMSAALLASILAGVASFDVESAVRLSRCLQLNPKTLMMLQLRHDFARARSNERLETIDVLADDGRFVFPDDGYISGRLAGLRDTSGYGEIRFETLGFFGDVAATADLFANMHEIRPGAKLRIYDDAGRPIWKGIVLQTLEGLPLLPYARPNTWIEWFANRHRADFIPAP